MITPRITGARFLDLCAGSGAVGIEALSRDAAHVTFVDRSRRMCALVEANLDLCKIPEDQTLVGQAEAANFLNRVVARKHKPWDIIFFDPPYATDYLQVLSLIGVHAHELLTEAGLLIIEHHKKNDLKSEVEGLIRTRLLRQGDSALSFYKRTGK